jgi:hypothetical protein
MMRSYLPERSLKTPILLTPVHHVEWVSQITALYILGRNKHTNNVITAYHCGCHTCALHLSERYYYTALLCQTAKNLKDLHNFLTFAV